MHVSSSVTQVVNTLSDSVHMQRCWAGWEPAGVKMLHSRKHIRPALIWLLVGHAVAVAVHYIHVLVLLSTSLFTLNEGLTEPKATPRISKRIQCLSSDP